MGGVQQYTISGVEMDGAPYSVTVYKNAINKIISDYDFGLDKIAIFLDLGKVLDGSRYFGSGKAFKYDAQGNPVAPRNNQIIRHDYFTAPVVLSDGKTHAVQIDVEVLKTENKYRTHHVINNIELVDDTSASGITRSDRMSTTTSSNDFTVPQGYHEVKKEDIQKSPGYAPGVAEDIDSLIERMYNEVEPDHFEPPAPPEEISEADEALIDEEWSGGASDFGSKPVPVKEDATFRTEIPEYSSVVNESISKAAKHAVQKGSERGGEHLVLIDAATGEWVFEEAGDARSVGNSEWFRRFVDEHLGGRFTYVHSHPSGEPLSLNDMVEFFGADQFESMVAAGYNGKVYVAYGKRARISAWSEVMKVDDVLLKDLRQQRENGKIDRDMFKKEAVRLRVEYLQERFCSGWEAET